VLTAFWKDMASDPIVSGQLYPPTEENVARWRDWVLKVHRGGGGQVVVAEVSGEVIGFVLARLRRDLSLQTPHTLATIYDLYVRPDWRQKGMGTALLKAALERLKARGATHVLVTAQVTNEAAIRLYRKLGFKDFRLTLVKRLE